MDIRWVSIPHRRAKNFSIAKAHSKPFFEFQSLIGELKTDLESIIEKGYKGFQSLIGELKTMFSLNLFLQPLLVSIPHRRAKNFVNKIVEKIKRESVSIPHRRAKNGELLTSLLFIYWVSIPHRRAKNLLSFKHSSYNWL